MLFRSVNAAQSANATIAFDLARAAHAWTADTTTLGRLQRALVPLELAVTRTLSSAYDGTPATPGLGLQFGLGGEDTFLGDARMSATTAMSNTQVALATGLRLPLGFTLDARTQRLATRNWLRRPDQTQVEIGRAHV